VFGPQRLLNQMLLTEPLSQIDQLAAPGTKWPISCGKPVALTFTSGTFDIPAVSHVRQPNTVRFALHSPASQVEQVPKNPAAVRALSHWNKPIFAVDPLHARAV
jgi:hypothetical protein